MSVLREFWNKEVWPWNNFFVPLWSENTPTLRPCSSDRKQQLEDKQTDHETKKSSKIQNPDINEIIFIHLTLWASVPGPGGTGSLCCPDRRPGNHRPPGGRRHWERGRRGGGWRSERRRRRSVCSWGAGKDHRASLPDPQPQREKNNRFI